MAEKSTRDLKQQELAKQRKGFTKTLPVEITKPANKTVATTTTTVTKEEKPVSIFKRKEKPEPTTTKASTAPAKKTNNFGPKKAPPTRTGSQPAKRVAAIDPKGDSKKQAKVYHVSQHKDGGWHVKAAKSEKSLKRFDTQKEALDHAKSVADSQNGSVRLHSKEGRIRKVS